MRALFLAAAIPALAGELRERRVETTLVPGPVNYTVWLPDGYESAAAPFPLLVCLHGGNCDQGFLRTIAPRIEEARKTGGLGAVVAVTADAGRSFYMDYRDGSRRWEQFFLNEFPDHLRKTYKVSADSKKTLLFGISMGGMGALRMGFKHPEKFGAVAALEPGIEPALRWKDVLPRDRFWRSPELMESIFGKPLDEEYWAANQPAVIARRNRDRIRASGLSIYLECGDQDSFGLNRGAEFLHQTLVEQEIRHEYHLVRGADHLGRTLGPRSIEALLFLGRALEAPPPDPAVEALRKSIEKMKAAYERKQP